MARSSGAVRTHKINSEDEDAANLRIGTPKTFGPGAPTCKEIVRPLTSWYLNHARDLPWRRSRDPYAIWISEIMLQQTQVATVIPYFERWMRALPDLQSLSAIPEPALLKLWEGLGYYSRVRNLQKAAKEICAGHGGIFPQNHADLLALPGIGPYTAGAICSIAFNQPKPIVDGNVSRVLSRVYAIGGDLSRGRPLQKLWSHAQVLVEAAAQEPDPNGNACGHFNQALMELGATICTPLSPRCPECPLAKVCKAFLSERVPFYPAKRVRPKSVIKPMVALVLVRGGKVFLRQRPSGTHNALFWELPSAEAGASDASKAFLLLTKSKAAASKARHLGTVRHSIMHSRIVLDAYRLEAPATFAADQGRWCTVDEIQKLPVATAHRKVLHLWRKTKRP